MTNDILLGVNIDHIATLRQARNTIYPEPIQAALLAEQAGADGITVHLREDRRHIQERDVEILKQTIETRLNLEMAATQEMLQFAQKINPTYCCLVPEKREELTTEGGLDIITQKSSITDACQQLADSDIQVSLFIEPDLKTIDTAKECGAPIIELHTGTYCDAKSEHKQQHELTRIIQACKHATEIGLQVNAGHGIHYHNVQHIAQIPEIIELNIGHSIIARATMTGIAQAVKDMKSLMLQARKNDTKGL